VKRDVVDQKKEKRLSFIRPKIPGRGSTCIYVMCKRLRVSETGRGKGRTNADREEKKGT